MTTHRQDDSSWRITVDVPMHLPDSERHKLFDAVVTVVGKWEPADRDGWDVSMSAGPADHTAEAYAERLEAELEDLRQHVRNVGAQRDVEKSANDSLTAERAVLEETLSTWVAYRNRKQAERVKHVEAFEDALGLPHAGRSYSYERMIQAADTVRQERDELQARIKALQGKQSGGAS